MSGRKHESCQICGIPCNQTESHHITPRYCGGGNGDNLIAVCEPCHSFIDRRRLRFKHDRDWLNSRLKLGDYRAYRLVGYLYLKHAAYIEYLELPYKPKSPKTLRQEAPWWLDDKSPVEVNHALINTIIDNLALTERKITLTLTKQHKQHGA